MTNLPHFADFYGRKHALVPRLHPPSSQWILGKTGDPDALTGNQLALIGSMPLVCHADAAHPGMLAALARAGMPEPTALRCYRTEDEFERVRRELVREGWRLVYTHSQPDEGEASDAAWVPQPLVRFLNNKGNLSALVPEEALPTRRILTAAERRSGLRTESLPFVLKVATDETTGGGGDVRVCTQAASVPAALMALGSAPVLMLEEFLPMTHSLCLGFAVLPTGDVRYLGAAEQICTPDGGYLGNWLEPGVPTPPAAVRIGFSIAAAAGRRGYRGFCGFDMAIADGANGDTEVRVFDLNFRVNGSTVALLMTPWLTDRNGLSCFQLTTLTSGAGFDALLHTLHVGQERGWLFPVSAYAGAEARLRVLVAGANRTDVTARIEELKHLGYDVHPSVAPEISPRANRLPEAAGS